MGPHRIHIHHAAIHSSSWWATKLVCSTPAKEHIHTSATMLCYGYTEFHSSTWRIPISIRIYVYFPHNFFIQTKQNCQQKNVHSKFLNKYIKLRLLIINLSIVCFTFHPHSLYVSIFSQMPSCNPVRDPFHDPPPTGRPSLGWWEHRLTTMIALI